MQNDTSSYTDLASQGNEKDNELWGIARRRAAFKITAFSYVTVNAMLTAIWYFSSGPRSYFWPAWPMLGWGIGIVTQYLHAYHSSELFSVQKEYEKLKNKQ